MTRVGAIDIGTNSTRLLIADVDASGLREIERRSQVTRLGEGVDAERLLLPEPIERVRRTLRAYRSALGAAAAERTIAVATSAVRDASNGRQFLAEVESDFGFATRLLSGEEEASLTLLGVGATAPGTLVLDVGGGSTELILADFRRSLDVGSVRLTERFLHGDPPSAAELSAAGAFVRALLPELDVRDAIGVAGTVTQLHELGGRLTLARVEAELSRLAALPLSERARIPRMDPARAPVIVGGTIVVLEVMRRYGVEELVWSRRDLLDGVALEAGRGRAAHAETSSIRRNKLVGASVIVVERFVSPQEEVKDMSTVTQEGAVVPAGRFSADAVHSSVSFEVRYMGISSFSGTVGGIEASLLDGRLEGSAEIASVHTGEDNLTAHLLSPEFFDAERYPKISFATTAARTEGDRVVFEGEITMKGHTNPATLSGTITGPVSDPYGNTRIGLRLETEIDRTAYGLEWNKEMPDGSKALADLVTLKADLSLVQAREQ